MRVPLGEAGRRASSSLAGLRDDVEAALVRGAVQRVMKELTRRRRSALTKPRARIVFRRAIRVV
jgi:hypothetical protein